MWEERQLFPHLLEMINEHREYFEGKKDMNDALQESIQELEVTRRKANNSDQTDKVLKSLCTSASSARASSISASSARASSASALSARASSTNALSARASSKHASSARASSSSDASEESSSSYGPEASPANASLSTSAEILSSSFVSFPVVGGRVAILHPNGSRVKVAEGTFESFGSGAVHGMKVADNIAIVHNISVLDGFSDVLLGIKGAFADTFADIHNGGRHPFHIEHLFHL